MGDDGNSKSGDSQSDNNKSKQSVENLKLNGKAKNNQKSKNDKKKTGLKSHWALKATIITFFLSAFFSFISELTASTGNLIVTILLLLFLICASILFDGIGVAVAACELPPLLAMASKKVPGSKMAIRLVKNAEVVSNICNDVIGDIFGVLSGACTAVIVGVLITKFQDIDKRIITILISSIVSSLIVGGKAVLKNYAINKSKEFVMLTARVISVFVKEKK